MVEVAARGAGADGDPDVLPALEGGGVGAVHTVAAQRGLILYVPKRVVVEPLKISRVILVRREGDLIGRRVDEDIVQLEVGVARLVERHDIKDAHARVRAREAVKGAAAAEDVVDLALNEHAVAVEEGRERGRETFRRVGAVLAYDLIHSGFERVVIAVYRAGGHFLALGVHLPAEVDLAGIRTEHGVQEGVAGELIGGHADRVLLVGVPHPAFHRLEVYGDGIFGITAVGAVRGVVAPVRHKIVAAVRRPELEIVDGHGVYPDRHNAVCVHGGGAERRPHGDAGHAVDAELLVHARIYKA